MTKYDMTSFIYDQSGREGLRPVAGVDPLHGGLHRDAWLPLVRLRQAEPPAQVKSVCHKI
jgi:hypothetical protein